MSTTEPANEMAPDAGVATEQPGALREVAALMFRLGWTAFGGPAAHIAMLRGEVVKRRQVDDGAALPRHDRRGEPRARPDFDADGDAFQLRPRGLAGPVRRRDALHPARRLPRARLRLALRALRHDDGRRLAALWHQAGDHRRRRAGALGAGADGGQECPARRVRRRGLRGLSARRQCHPAPLRRGAHRSC